MILPYLARLLCLSLACFFFVHLALGLAVSILAPAALAVAGRARPRSAAGFLFAMRLFPAAAGLLVVIAVCVPSYLWLEPETAGERVGLFCLGAVFLSVASWSVSLARALRAISRSIHYGCPGRSTVRVTTMAGETVWVMEGAGGLLALAGIARPRLVISRDVLDELSADQLDAALRHERAHRISRDNLKRLLLILTPGLLPFNRAVEQPTQNGTRRPAVEALFGGARRVLCGFEALERGWSQFTEWAADDQAVAGDTRRRFSLAAALVRVARLRCGGQPSPLMTSLLADGRDLEARVDRLLGTAPVSERKSERWPIFGAAMFLLSAGITMVALGPATLQAAHWLLEYVVR